MIECPRCEGTGQVYTEDRDVSTTCLLCKGSGKLPDKKGGSNGCM
jgi:DnaJ-class molecular chaperone